MSDILSTFRQKAEGLAAAINRAGGVRATIEGLRRQMAEADRRRAMAKAKGQLKRLDVQLTEMVTAVGVQAVGLLKLGKLASLELAPLCQHIVELEAQVATHRAELARLEALAEPTAAASEAAASEAERDCPHCGRVLPEEATFCPYCGQAAPLQDAAALAERFCAHCGTPLREGARFCARCGKTVGRPRQ
jgi:RNA polymerase subunit RPABC4/transcription elongation factor Spt4